MMQEYPVLDESKIEKDDEEEAVVRTIKSIAKRCKHFLATNSSEADRDAFNKSITSEQHELVTQYPLVFKYMIYLDVFNEVALRAHVHKTMTTQPKSLDEQIELMIGYVMLVYKCGKHHIAPEHMATMKEMLTKALKDDFVGFQDKLKGTVSATKEARKTDEDKTRSSFLDYFNKNKDAIKADMEYQEPKIA
jgi:hypothetical protein